MAAATSGSTELWVTVTVSDMTVVLSLCEAPRGDLMHPTLDVWEYSASKLRLG
ncbi:hypothetical protein GCM10025867_22230 [Frondihabitans sucicola]|uniref:Uncharacterized protein n=1 Tax=Frondihabitans sucicola TaxID=1268041 RepID=A0ABN6Y1K0_9MICO|nr:hypothetical protein GCM10025867_22230 [Frondihabitans sucicola]